MTSQSPTEGWIQGLLGFFMILIILTLSYSESIRKLEAERTALGVEGGGTGPTSGCLVLTYAKQKSVWRRIPFHRQVV